MTWPTAAGTLYDAGKGKGDSKPESKAAPKAEGSGDGRIAEHKKARDDMHKRHRTERRDIARPAPATRTTRCTRGTTRRSRPWTPSRMPR